MCKRKSWFDQRNNMRLSVYASSVVHATETHLRSLIRACICMRVYTNSGRLDALSERGISKSSGNIFNKNKKKESGDQADLNCQVLTCTHNQQAYAI